MMDDRPAQVYFFGHGILVSSVYNLSLLRKSRIKIGSASDSI